MNRLHRWYCSSDHWARVVSTHLLPWTLGTITLGEHLLELGAGPGRATPLLAARAGRVTSVDIDLDALARLRRRATGADVVGGSATALPFATRCFSSVAALTMVHHVPAGREQIRLFDEVFRVLQPGGWFVGCDPLNRVAMRLVHIGSTFTPFPPDTLAVALIAAGFYQIDIGTTDHYLRWSARRP